MRNDGRQEKELRKIEIHTNVYEYPEGSVVISFGKTMVICSATIVDQVPDCFTGSGTGWISAEYRLLARATKIRKFNESIQGKLGEDTIEIQRLIGRVLRTGVDLEKLGERSILIDCDVVQADGGTTTASITGAFLALKIAVDQLISQKLITENPIKGYLAAVSVGISASEQLLLDMDTKEELTASVMMNLVMTETGEFVEVQSSGKQKSFTGEELNELLLYGKTTIEQLIAQQKEASLTQAILSDNLVEDKTILVATRNNGKAQEFTTLFSEKGYQVKTLLDYPNLPDIEETGRTFEENARLKAETMATWVNQPVLADDSGLLVDALNGLPGVYSARFAGEAKSDAANNAKLLHELTDIPKENRTATFHCTLVLAAPGKESLVVEGEWAGEILNIPRGTNGFGYDSLFYIPSEKKSAAEMTEQQKNKQSHRGKAIEQLKNQWASWLGKQEDENELFSGE